MSTNLFSPFVTIENTPLPISGTVGISGTVNAVIGNASSSAITRVNTSGTSTIALAANANRQAAIIMSEAGTYYIAYAATATTTAYTVLMGPTTALTITGYTGVISVIMASGNGNIQVTELT